MQGPGPSWSWTRMTKVAVTQRVWEHEAGLPVSTGGDTLLREVHRLELAAPVTGLGPAKPY